MRETSPGLFEEQADGILELRGAVQASLSVIGAARGQQSIDTALLILLQPQVERAARDWFAARRIAAFDLGFVARPFDLMGARFLDRLLLLSKR